MWIERKVQYHSELWAALVEAGWRTWTVETVGGVEVATMVRGGRS